MSHIAVRRVPIPVLDFIPALVVGMVVFGVSTVWAESAAAVIAWGTELMYLYYCLSRLANHNGKPLTIPVPWIAPPVAAVAIKPPPRRYPAAWPPKPGQCYVCGTYDHDREGVFGDNIHWTCKEWLGNWSPPEWRINNPVIGIITRLPGTMTAAEVVEHVRATFPNYNLVAQQSAVGDGEPRNIAIDAVVRKKPIDPDLVRRFYEAPLAGDVEFAVDGRRTYTVNRDQGSGYTDEPKMPYDAVMGAVERLAADIAARARKLAPKEDQ